MQFGHKSYFTAFFLRYISFGFVFISHFCVDVAVVVLVLALAFAAVYA